MKVKEEVSKILSTKSTKTTKNAIGMSSAAIFAPLVLSSVLVALSPMTAAFAQTVSCGDTITKSTALASDVGPCPENGIIIGADNITLDCNGHSITAASGNSYPSAGVEMIGHSGVTIRNCIVTGFNGYGFHLEKSSNNKLLGNKAINNNQGFVVNGDFATNSDKNTLDRNTATGNAGNGFSVSFDSNYNSLTRNTASGNQGAGFYLYVTDYNTLTGNTATNNGYAGVDVDIASNNKLTGNTAASNDKIGFTISGSSNTLTGNTARSNGDNGFTIADSSNTLTGNRADTNTGFGYQDSTQGTGTKGTANTYRGNECHGNGAGGSSPSGLCRPQA